MRKSANFSLVGVGHVRHFLVSQDAIVSTNEKWSCNVNDGNNINDCYDMLISIVHSYMINGKKSRNWTQKSEW